MLKGKWQDVVMQYLLCMLAFFIPFPFICTAVCIAALLIVWLLGARFKETFTNLSRRKMLWVWIAYFLLHAISYTYSINKAQSSFDLQSKLSFFILPVVLGAGLTLDRKVIERIFLFFNIGVSLIAIYCFGHAIERCVQEGYFYKRFFFYNDLVDSLDASAVYMAWYVITSICAMLFLPWQHAFTGRQRFLKSFMIGFQLLFFIMLSARTLMLLFFLFVIPYYLYTILKHSKVKVKVWQAVSFCITVILIGAAIIATDNPVKKRFSDIFQKDLSIAWLKDYSNVPQKEFSNLTLRLMTWRIGYENMNEHNLWWFGAGNGDVQDLQNQKMAAYGIDVYNTDPEKRSEFYNLNLHNMPIESVMMLGIPGLILVLFIIFAPLFYIRGIYLKHLFFVFQIIAICFLMQEAALQTQAGIVYYTFFSILFLNISYANLKARTDETVN